MSENNYIGMGHNPNPNVPDIPEGLSMALMQEPGARDSFQGLSDAQKTEVIRYIQSGNSTGDEAKNKIDNVIKRLRDKDLT